MHLSEKNKFTQGKNSVHFKKNPMLKENSILSQFLHENETWKRMLVFIQDENINIKNRLSAVVKEMDGGEDIMLEQIEYFQNRFLEEEENLRRLKKEVESQNQLLIKDIYEDGVLFNKVKNRQLKLRKEMEKMEKDFNRLKFEFNNYLSGTL
jgi:hypothetical protein